MFPVPLRDRRQNGIGLSTSSFERSQHQRLSQLPNFKRSPLTRFHSQERRKLEKFQLAAHHHLTPNNRNGQRGSFFRVSDPSLGNRNKQTTFIGSSAIFKVSKEPKNRRLFKNSHQKDQSKIRKSTDCYESQSKNSFQNLTKQSLRKDSKNKKIVPFELLRNHNNLQPYEKQQLVTCSQVFYFGQNCQKKRASLSELTKANGAYNWVQGDQVNFRYQIQDILGEGSFGEVFKCYDHKKNKQVALKIVKNNEKYIKQAKTQIKLLNFIKSKDPSSSKNVIHIKDYFQFRGRICMVFDLMSINLYELIKNNGYYGLPLDLVRRMALQVLNALCFLHKNQIIHADLKPENILLREANKSGIKVIDFGSSCFEKETIYTYIQSRYYRAPEVILGIQYNRKIDIWSFACIMAELHLGYPLFAGDEEHEQMCLIIQVLGLPPQNMFKAAKRWDVFFDRNSELKAHPKKVEPNSKTLKAALENPQDDQFIDFLAKCFQWDPQKRFEALDCLKHNWIIKGLPEQIRKQHLKFIQDQERKRTQEPQEKHRSFSLNSQRLKLFQ